MRPGPGRAVQLTLEFPPLDADQRPLIEAGCYGPPLAALRRWRSWPEGQLVLQGEEASGKTRLLRRWALEAGAALTTGEALAAASIDDISTLAFAALGVDDAEGGKNGLGLLAALNLCRQRGAPVLMTSRKPPADWYEVPGDLRSRLSSVPVAEIAGPDDEALAARLREACILRHLVLPEESISYLVQRMERSWRAVEMVASQIERTKGRGDTVRSARNVLAALAMDSAIAPINDEED